MNFRHRIRWIFEKKLVEPFLVGTFGRWVWSPVSVSVAATTGDKLLVLKAPEGYSLPGGLNKKGEELHETASREVREETGCLIEDVKVIEFRTSAGMFRGVHFFFEATISITNLRASWEGAPELVELEALDSLNWASHHSHVSGYFQD